MKKGYLVLENGQAFEGYRFGAEGTPMGELVFTTGMTGYMETLSDPSFYGQIILHTFPLIGNVGSIESDMESAGIYAAGYVVREICPDPSNFRSEGTLDAFLKEKGIPGLCGVDTRAITRILREAGVMNARIVDAGIQEPNKGLEEYRATGVVAAVSCKEQQVHPAFPVQGGRRHCVALLDLGAKRSIIHALQRRGCEVQQLPHTTSAEEVLQLAPDGLLLSNGPGDPTENAQTIEEIKKLLGKLPIFGICLGHQLLALAAGASTEKMKYGHRGENQPVKELATGRVYITAQNHGYAVKGESVAQTGGSVCMVNANDGSCEGLEYPAMHAFSVQFHPEAGGGPLDTQFLFDRFIRMMEEHAYAAQ